jgi:hypothetical protein
MAKNRATMTTPHALALEPLPLSLNPDDHLPLKNLSPQARYVDAMAVSTRAAQAGKTFTEAFGAGVAAMTAPRLTRVVFHAGTAMSPALNAAAAAAVSPAPKKAAATAAATAAAAAAASAALPPIEGLLVRVLPSPSAASVAVGDVVAFRAPGVSPEEERAVGAWPARGQAEVSS